MEKRKTTKRKSKEPFVLVTVSGGVASVFPPKGVEWDLIDWDEFDNRYPSRSEIADLYFVASQIPDRKVRAAIQSEIEELEGKGTAEDLEEMAMIEMEDKRERRRQK